MWQSAKVPVVNTQDYRIFFQLLHLNGIQLVFVHCDVINWSNQVSKRLRLDFNALCDLYGGDLFALNELTDTKHQKFLTFYGFEPLSEVTGDDGVVRNIYIRKQGL